MRAPWPGAQAAGGPTTSRGEIRQGRWLGLALLDLYRLLVSPRLQARCGFTPSCSQYASLAVERHGLVVGWFRAADRLMRCNPFRDPGDYPRHAGRCMDSP
ncbi:MAG: membrane protein insertion efficiency factor YidD [Planctomycetes bacterium]|nr:membrane protein insertion efficiency factor YidD [Planctomycetota bacterium]